MKSAAVAPLLAAALPWCDPVVRFAPLFERKSVPKGTVLLHQGELSTEAYLIERGSMRLYFVRPDGREFNKNFYAEGGLVMPVMPVMWAEPSLFGIATMEATLLWRADAGALREALRDAGLWHTVQRKALVHMVSGKLQREHDLLALTGRERYAAFCREHPGLAERIPLNQLAGYLGITDVSLSRIRRTDALPDQLIRRPAR